MTPYTYPMGYQSHSFVSKNGRKQVLDDTYLRYLLYYRQISSMGHHVVFNYPRVSFRVPTTLMTPYSYRMGHHNVDKCSIVKNLVIGHFSAQMSGYGGS